MEASESVSSNQRNAFEDGSEECSRPAKLQRKEPEGDYLAALRGSNSEHWQNSLSKVGNARGAASRGRGRGSPYPKSSRLVAEEHQEGPKEPERLCPCGAGACLVLTANTAKNQGRRFYRCPLRKEEGQCNFFEWFDNASYGGSEVLSGGSGATFRSSQPQAELLCPCGAGACLVRCAKSEKNMGRSFYRCPIDQEQGGCGFFKWCEEVGSNAAPAHNTNTQTRAGLSDIPRNAAKDVTGACFKCGMSGHWSNNCSSAFPSGLLNDARSTAGKGSHGGGTAFGSCFKCGQDGHWAKDCLNSTATGPNIPRNIGSPYEQKGQFLSASSVPKTPNASVFSKVENKGPSFGASGFSHGNCFKCGSPGHWASKCPKK